LPHALVYDDVGLSV
jgi:hypothetical protein